MSEKHWITTIRLRDYFGYILSIVIFLFLSIALSDKGFLTGRNLMNIVRQPAIIALMSIGMTFVLAMGEIDLSIGAVAALASITTALTLEHSSLWAAILAGLGSGVIVGVFNGLIAARLKIPSFFVTLCTMGIVSGLARWLSKSKAVSITHSTYAFIFGSGDIGSVPIVFFWLAMGAIAGHLTLKHTRFGKSVIGIGSYEMETLRSGRNVLLIKVMVMTMNSTLAALAGMLYAGRLRWANYTLGAEDLMTVIAAVVIGGTSLFGGHGSVIGSIVGAFTMGMVNNGLLLMGLSIEQQMIFRGIIIITAVTLALHKKAAMNPVLMAAAYIDQIAKGTIPKKITDEYHGDFNQITDNLNTLIETMDGLLSETHRLIQSVQQGKLDVRAPATRFVGEWQQLVMGINNVIEAFFTPITAAAAALDSIARGNLPEKIHREYQGDFNTIKVNLNAMIDALNEVTQLAQAMAQGDLTKDVRERSDQDRLMHALNLMRQRLHDVVTNVKTAVSLITQSSQEIRLTAEDMAQGASAQAAATSEVSVSMEQITVNIRQNANNAKATEQIALEATRYAEACQKVVTDTMSAMQQIAQKIGVIEKIAAQTKILSLNATIEAARAHESGQAFSRVAAEVRQLSTVIKHAAAEINALARSSLQISETAHDMLTVLVLHIEKTAALVQEIRAASVEQSRGAEHVNVAIQQLDRVTQQHAASSEQMAAMSEEFAAQARQLQQTIEFFTIGNQ